MVRGAIAVEIGCTPSTWATFSTFLDGFCEGVPLSVQQFDFFSPVAEDEVLCTSSRRGDRPLKHFNLMMNPRLSYRE